MWRCRCDCGEDKIVAGHNLKAQKIISCGCAKREQVGQLNRTHAGSNTRLYSIFTNMISRTENPKATAYALYGGRGIKICDEWRESFQVFRDWALANGYTDQLSIDRIDNDKGYCPSNCRWVEQHSQFVNRRSTRRLTFQGETMSVKEWARKIGIPYHTLIGRLNAGWPVERALQESTECNT